MTDLIPISELPRVTETSFDDLPEPRISWGVELPPSVDQNRIVLNHGYLKQLQRLGSFHHNTVATFDGQREEFDATIQGVNPDGTGMIGSTIKLQKAEDGQVKLIHEFEDPLIRDNYGKALVHVALNKPAMVDEVVEKRRRDISPEKAWAQVIDSHLQTSMRSAAKAILIDKEGPMKIPVRIDHVGVPFLLGFIASDVVNNDVGFGTVISTAILFGPRTVGLALDSLSNKRAYGDAAFDKRRWSFFMSSQPEKYIAFGALTRARTLVGVRK